MHAEGEALGRFEVKELQTVDGTVAAADYGVRDQCFVVCIERKFDANHLAG